MTRRQKKSPSVCQPTGKEVFETLRFPKTISPGSTRTNDPLINSQQAPDRGGGAGRRLAQYQRGRPKAQPPFSAGWQTDGESGFQDFALPENQLPCDIVEFGGVA